MLERAILAAHQILDDLGQGLSDPPGELRQKCRDTLKQLDFPQQYRGRQAEIVDHDI